MTVQGFVWLQRFRYRWKDVNFHFLLRFKFPLHSVFCAFEVPVNLSSRQSCFARFWTFVFMKQLFNLQFSVSQFQLKIKSWWNLRAFWLLFAWPSCLFINKGSKIVQLSCRTSKGLSRRYMKIFVSIQSYKMKEVLSKFLESN